jgi:hypothetical protein
VTDNTAVGIVYDKDGRAFVQICYGSGKEAREKGLGIWAEDR